MITEEGRAVVAVGQGQACDVIVVEGLAAICLKCQPFISKVIMWLLLRNRLELFSVTSRAFCVFQLKI